MTTRTLAPCGTRAGYERHWGRGEPIDGACRSAYNRRMLAFQRARTALADLPEMRAEFWFLFAQQPAGRYMLRRARAELARLHPERFRQLLDKELAGLGIRICRCGAEVPGDACWSCGTPLNPAS